MGVADEDEDPALDPEVDPEVDPREAARDRRRDRNHSAHARALMRTGLAKGFKQILDAQAHRAERAARRDDRSADTQRSRGKPKDEHRRS
jgi:hypothetical protein